MGDASGYWNIGAYHQGMMAGKTPNLDKLAAECMSITDYYAEASCTAGRANFITGELPIRTGMTTVGQAGSPIFFFSSRRRHTRSKRDWSSDVCSSDLHGRSAARRRTVATTP